MSADNSSPSLNQRGLKWFFRTVAARRDVHRRRCSTSSRPSARRPASRSSRVTLFHEDTIFGTDCGNAQRKLAGRRGIKVVADIKYRANSPSLSAEVQQLKAANADVLMPSQLHQRRASCWCKAMDEIGYKPNAIMAQAAGFPEQAFLDGGRPAAEGVISRSSFALDAVKARPAIPAVNALFKAKSGKDLNDNTSRQLTA